MRRELWWQTWASEEEGEESENASFSASGFFTLRATTKEITSRTHKSKADDSYSLEHSRTNDREPLAREALHVGRDSGTFNEDRRHDEQHPEEG